MVKSEKKSIASLLRKQIGGCGSRYNGSQRCKLVSLAVYKSQEEWVLFLEEH